MHFACKKNLGTGNPSMDLKPASSASHANTSAPSGQTFATRAGYVYMSSLELYRLSIRNLIYNSPK